MLVISQFQWHFLTSFKGGGEVLGKGRTNCFRVDDFVDCRSVA